jgi:hypothetical protein
MSHSDILPLLIRNQFRSEETEGFKGHESSGVYASGKEKVKRARAAAVPQTASISFVSIGSLSRLLKRVVP